MRVHACACHVAPLVVTPAANEVVTDGTKYSISYPGQGSYVCYKLATTPGTAWTVCDSACTDGTKATAEVAATALGTMRWLSVMACDSSNVLIGAVTTSSYVNAGKCRCGARIRACEYLCVSAWRGGAEM